MDPNTIFALILILLLIILGIVTFHYYAYISVGSGSALNTGAGFNMVLLPERKQQQ